MYTYIKISIAIITVFLIVIVINSYLVYREKQNYKLAEIYKFITQDVAKDLYQYYKKLAKPYQR
jgi:hypothetical protein